MDYLEVTFRIQASSAEATALVDSILLEQTVETPAEVARRDPFIREHLLGEVIEIHRTDDASTRAKLRLPLTIVGNDPAQFLNLLFGNVSLHGQVTLEEFEVPDSLASLFPGPRFGVDGIRERLGVVGRPLTCSALKPVGSSVEKLAAICRAFAMGGIDVIKDDHYLANQSFSPFKQRVDAFQEVVRDVASRTGRNPIYCPNLSGSPDDLLRQLEYAQRRGVGAVMLAPALVGLPVVHQLIRAHIEVPLLAHPSFAGGSGIRLETYLGRLLRLFGADAVIFANYGGRFALSAEMSYTIASNLRSRWHSIAASLPVPAGGMTVERAPELIEFFGIDTMLLVGGGLLSAGDALLDRTLEFTEAVAATAHKLSA